MNIHEYQAKQLLATFGVPVPKGAVASTVDAAMQAAQGLGDHAWVVKAQIHAGGRGKAGGVQLCDSLDAVRDASARMLGSVLVTAQTGADGKAVRKVYIEQASTIAQEYYVSLLIDRTHECLSCVASSDGGMDIEAVAARTPDRILTLPLTSQTISDNDVQRVCDMLGLDAVLQEELAVLLQRLLTAFYAVDADLIEINPLVLTGDGHLCVLDAKISLDDNALYRHADLRDLRDIHEEDPLEVEASGFGLNYIALDGNIGCMVNGAGLAMATMDMIQMKGEQPANFLDVGGGVTEATVTEGFRLLFRNRKLKAVLVNIFGGIVRCDVIAKGLLQASTEFEQRVPVVLRLVGTHEQEGRRLIDEAGLEVYWAHDLDTAAELAASTVRGAA